MLCYKCGYYASEDDIVCPSCGELLKQSAGPKESGAQAIRQGKRAREEIRNHSVRQEDEIRRRRRSGASHATVQMPVVRDSRGEQQNSVSYSSTESTGSITQDSDQPDDGFDRGYKPVYADGIMSDEQAAAYAAAHRNDANQHFQMVNWMKVGICLFFAGILVVAGGWLFLKKTDTGQRLMARFGREANSTALWAVGEELLDKGDINGAIEDFLRARDQDALNNVVDVDGLLLLGSAYEANNMIDEAAQLYTEIYTETPSRTEAYVNHIRILLSSNKPGDKAKAGELMKLAYEKTGETSFDTQRRDLLPAAPEVDLTAGFYETKKNIEIKSYQGYSVYYTFDENAELPAGGTLYTGRVFLDEGIHSLRAVAVNGELVSDELHGTYKIIMPSPQTPRSSLAPNTYKQRQKVRLKPGLDNENDDDIVIYYTIDGSPPDADSPIYNGEPFWLPGGRVTLKAVAVNKYSKVSNTLEILYKIEAKPYPLSAYTSEDTVSGFTLYSTTMTEFQEKYGTGTLKGNVTLEDLDTECRRYDYDWGYAVMSKARNGWLVAEVYCKDNTFRGPRGTSVGDTDKYVVGKFCDMGQVESPSGNRGLYSNKNGTGKILIQEDESKIIRYKCVTPDSHWWQLDYIVNRGGEVKAIDMRYLQ